MSTLELAGNALCLDFANSVNTRRHHPVNDYVTDYADLLEWSGHAGSLTPQAIRRLREHIATSAAGKTLAKAHRLRETIYAVFSPIAQGRPAPVRDVDAVSEAYSSAMGRATVRQSSQGFGLSWPVDEHLTADAPLWPIGRSAGELLLSGPLERLGECPGCGWLFLDTSRNGARRWCSMATCGSRDKMARYHRQQREAGVD